MHHSSQLAQCDAVCLLVMSSTLCLTMSTGTCTCRLRRRRRRRYFPFDIHNALVWQVRSDRRVSAGQTLRQSRRRWGWLQSSFLCCSGNRRLTASTTSRRLKRLV